MRHIVVSSDCQTAGIAATLAYVFPCDKITALPLPAFTNPKQKLHLVETLKSADAWVTLGHYDLVETKGFENFKPHFQIIKLPTINFPAFHPDICYAKKLSSGEYVVPHYNSAIVVWAYQHDLSRNDAQWLFNQKTYHALGYFDKWTPSVARLQRDFASCGMQNDWDRFLLYVKRNGNFMHTSNHPKIQTLVRLGKIIATRLGGDESVYEREIEINDALTYSSWPVYPEIADALSIPGTGYLWKMDAGTYLAGISNYIDYAYDTYRKQGITPDDIGIVHYEASLLDRVLGPQTGAAK